MFEVVHAFLHQAAVHVLGVPHAPAVQDVSQPALSAGGVVQNHIVDSLHLLDILGRRIARAMSYYGGQMNLTAFCRELRSVYSEDVLDEIWIHFLISPFRAEIVGNRRYII